MHAKTVKFKEPVSSKCPESFKQLISEDKNHHKELDSLASERQLMEISRMSTPIVLIKVKSWQAD
jgi:hypothetical protein